MDTHESCVVCLFSSLHRQRKNILRRLWKKLKGAPEKKFRSREKYVKDVLKAEWMLMDFLGEKFRFTLYLSPPTPLPIRCKFEIFIELNKTSKKIPLRLIKTGSKKLKLWMSLWNMFEYLWVIVCDKLINFPHEHTWDNFRITFFSVNKFA